MNRRKAQGRGTRLSWARAGGIPEEGRPELISRGQLRVIKHEMGREPKKRHFMGNSWIKDTEA